MYLEGSGCHSRRLDGLPIDDGKERGVHGLAQRGVEAIVRTPLWCVADRVPRAAQAKHSVKPSPDTSHTSGLQHADLLCSCSECVMHCQSMQSASSLNFI